MAEVTGEGRSSLYRSVERILNDGRQRKWPNREDYARWYSEQGIISSPEELDDWPEILGAIMLDWVRRGQTACQFAAVLASKYESAGWQSVVFPERGDQSDLGRRAHDVLTNAEGHAEIVQLLFPYVTDEIQLVNLINDLCHNEHWYWEKIGDPSDDSVLVGLRWLLATGKHVSWNVGFGPFASLPFTRRAPFTAILVRVNSFKRTANPPDKSGLIPVHLADMDDLLPSDSARFALNEKTRTAKTNYLKGELIDAARARVTFRVPSPYSVDLCPHGRN